MGKILLTSVLLLSACVATVPTQSVLISAPASMLKTAHKLAAYDFKDPEAALFRDDKLYSLANGDHAVCGAVNGRNSFGAYAGFKPYYVRFSRGISKNKQFDIAAKVACKQLASGVINVGQ